MGLHICLCKEYNDHPDWDYLRGGNDRDFPGLIDFTKVVYHPDIEDRFRPTNIKEIRLNINKQTWENKDRYHKLLDLLEQDKDYYLYFSY